MNFKNTARLVFAGACAVALVACSVSFTTSHISSLVLTKDSENTTESSTFAPSDTIYAKGVVSNVSGKVTLQWHLIAEKVAGQSENFLVTNLDKSFELPGDGSTTYNLSPPDNGFPPGKYRIELHMLVESGEEKDLKVAPFTIVAN